MNELQEDDDVLLEVVWPGLAIIVLPCFAMSPANLQAQEKHVVSSQECLRSDRPAEARGANEPRCDSCFSSEQAQQALKSVNIGLQQSG